MLAAGGAVALVGQVAFTSTFGDAPLLPDLFAEIDATVIDNALSVQAQAPATAVAPVAAATTLTRAQDGFEPVGLADEAQQADAAKLAKASRLAEAARAAQDQAAKAEAQAVARNADLPSVRGSKCAPNRAGLAGVKSWVSTAGVQLRCIFGVATVGGIGSRAGASDHPGGLALDFMVGRAAGDELADYALRYMDVLKIKYVIWKQRINFGNGWQAMEDRGGITANHFDHVHISFDAR
jgi:hypothetical protein